MDKINRKNMLLFLGNFLTWLCFSIITWDYSHLIREFLFSNLRVNWFLKFFSFPKAIEYYEKAFNFVSEEIQ